MNIGLIGVGLIGGSVGHAAHERIDSVHVRGFDLSQAALETALELGAVHAAGAEAAGVENARGDIFAGAIWYLTPIERTSGVLYERLYRTISSLGARPTAIDPDTHDRVMATVSHLPHAIANVLVGQAASALL